MGLPEEEPWKACERLLQRTREEMKNRILPYVLIVLFAVMAGMIWVIRSMKDQDNMKVFDATINRECAPWDGAAFKVSIPYEAGSVIEISVWRSPDIKSPTAFTFADQNGKTGDAFYVSLFGTAEPASGIVSFKKVEEDGPVQGEFNLRTDNGYQVQGKFHAIWENKIAICG
jgi:hypothetical protein